VQADSQASYDPAGPDPAAAFSEAEYQQYLVQRAMELMKGEFQTATWQAFWDFVVEGQPAAEVGRRLGISENAVYLAKGRVLRRLRQELAGLWD
jgi:RNA polymerase sigma-70 factor (ECF subfamily)